MDDLFETYTALLEASRPGWQRRSRGGGTSRRRARRARAAKALDLVRGILPAASLSHMGIYASGQTYEQLVSTCSRIPLAEARAYGEMLLEELQAVMPSFVTRVPRSRPRRPLDRVSARAPRGGRHAAGRLGLDEPSRRARRPCASSARTGTEDELARRAPLRGSPSARRQALAAVAACRRGRAALVRELVATRENRATGPGRGFETLTTGSRSSPTTARSATPAPPLLTCQWQRLSPGPRRRRPARGRGGGARRRVRARARRRRAEYERLRGEGLVEEAPYALCLAYRIRYVLELDAREALHLIELRSGREGHPSYRRRRAADAATRSPPSTRDVAAAMTLRRRLDRAPAREAALRDAQ
jgi:thymidylate synthase ThyX